jgi:hypothetical protein
MGHEKAQSNEAGVQAIQHGANAVHEGAMRK